MVNTRYQNISLVGLKIFAVKSCRISFEFSCYCEDYLISLKKILEYNDFRLDNLDNDEESKEKIYDILIQIKNSDYYHKEYSKRTKEEFKSALLRLLEYHDLSTDSEESEILPNNFKAYVTDSEKDLTDPDDLPTPSDVKKLCRQLESQSNKGTGIRNALTLLTTWETMARIGCIMNIKLGDIKFKDEVTEITLPGIKDSPTRNFDFFLVTPLMKYYIENIHPNPEDENSYLFVKLRGKNRGERVGYKGYTDKGLRKAYKRIKPELDCNIEGQTNHIFRKARRTYCHRAELMPPEMIKKMGGWSPNSDVDPIYQRLKDQDVSNSYLNNYGFQEQEREVEEDVTPLKCKGCSRVNVGYRITCLKCGKKLDTAYPDGVDYVDPDEEKIKAEGYQKGLEYKLQNPDAGKREVLDEVEGKISELMEEEFQN